MGTERVTFQRTNDLRGISNETALTLLNELLN